MNKDLEYHVVFDMRNDSVLTITGIATGLVGGREEVCDRSNRHEPRTSGTRLLSASYVLKTQGIVLSNRALMSCSVGAARVFYGDWVNPDAQSVVPE